MIRKARNLYYTLKNYHPNQLLYRLRYRLRSRKVESNYKKNPSSNYDTYLKKYKQQKPNPHPDPKYLLNDRFRYFGKVDAVLSNSFTFLNHTIDFGNQIDWHHPSINKGTRLWKMMLNYQEYLWDIAKTYKSTGDKKYLDYLVNCIKEWKVNNPIGTETYYRDNWNSYSISFRLTMWFKIYQLLHKEFTPEFKSSFLESLWIQSEFLYDNLELDLLGNHILKNWMALNLSAAFFQEKKYKAKADELYRKFIVGQFTESFNHEELSPMYSAIVLEDLMEAYLFNPTDSLENLCCRQYENIIQLTNGEQYVFFNDSVRGNGILPTDLTAFFKKVFPNYKLQNREGVIAIDGYYGFQSDEMMIVFDGGPVIEGNQPAHVHCDALSFECFRGTQKIFTNSGTFGYNPTKERIYSRGTAGHNTLQYGAFNQSEVQGSFRLARRATIETTVLVNDPKALSLKSTLTGFDFSKKIIHERQFDADNQQIVIKDIVNSKSKDQTTSQIYFHLAPPFTYQQKNGFVYVLHGEKQIAQITLKSAFTIETTEFYPEFGMKVPKQTLILQDILPEKEIRTDILFL